MKKQNTLKEENPSEEMATLWQRVLSGALGGALITSGLWFYTSSITRSWLIPLVLAIVGIIAIFYGRKFS